MGESPHMCGHSFGLIGGMALSRLNIWRYAPYFVYFGSLLGFLIHGLLSTDLYCTGKSMLAAFVQAGVCR